MNAYGICRALGIQRLQNQSPLKELQVLMEGSKPSKPAGSVNGKENSRTDTVRKMRRDPQGPSAWPQNNSWRRQHLKNNNTTCYF